MKKSSTWKFSQGSSVITAAAWVAAVMQVQSLAQELSHAVEVPPPPKKKHGLGVKQLNSNHDYPSSKLCDFTEIPYFLWDLAAYLYN